MCWPSWIWIHRCACGTCGASRPGPGSDYLHRGCSWCMLHVMRRLYSLKLFLVLPRAPETKWWHYPWTHEGACLVSFFVYFPFYSGCWHWESNYHSKLSEIDHDILDTPQKPQNRTSAIEPILSTTPIKGTSAKEETLTVKSENSAKPLSDKDQLKEHVVMLARASLLLLKLSSRFSSLHLL